MEILIILKALGIVIAAGILGGLVGALPIMIATIVIYWLEDRL